ncbi:reverse transcriptase domain-containing protein [Tanacetum coccineum]
MQALVTEQKSTLTLESCKPWNSKWGQVMLKSRLGNVIRFGDTGKFIEDVITKKIVYHLFDDEVEFLGCVILSYLLALEITCSCFHDFIDKDLIDLVLPDVRSCPNQQRKRIVSGNIYNKKDNEYYSKTYDSSTYKHMAPRAVLMKTGLKSVNTARPVNTVRSVNTGRPFSTASNSQLNDKGFVDSGCSRHMTGNISHLSNFKDFDGGYVTFGGGAYGGRITGKGFGEYIKSTSALTKYALITITFFLKPKPITIHYTPEDNLGRQSHGKLNGACFLRCAKSLIHQDLIDTGTGALQIRITPNSDLIKDRPTFVSTDWRHPWDPTLKTLQRSRMTKQGNFTQRTPQAKKQSDQASRQVSKQASGSANTPYDLVFPAMGPSLGTTQTTATITSTEGLQRATFTTPPQTVPGTNTTEPPPPPIRNKGPELGADNLTLEGVATELAPSDFVSQNYETLVALMQEETKKRSSQSLQARLNFGPEDNYLHQPPAPPNKRRGKDDRPTSCILVESERRFRVLKRLTCRTWTLMKTMTGASASVIGWAVAMSTAGWDKGAPRVKVLQVRTSRTVGASTAEEQLVPQNDTSERTRTQKQDTGNPRTNIVKTKTKICPVHGVVKRSTHLRGALAISRRIRKGGCLLLKKCAKNPVELARVKQRQGESTSAYVERYKDECIHVKACPEILKISGFMNGINNPELIKRLNDRVPQTFDELMKRTRSFIQGEAAAADSRKGYSNNRSQEQSRRQSNDQSSSRNNSYRVTNWKVAIHPDYPEQEVSIGGSLSDTGRAAVCALLQRNLDIFAWEPKHMTGVPRSITEHKLKIRQGYSPVRQKKRGQAPERAKAILEEVHKLVEAGIMREVYYHDWLSNPVMVKKSDGSWRMCVDFTDLNKACPQDCYPLPEIDWKVESLCGYPFKCFLDAYKGYHQIQMAKDDEEKTAFHTSQGVYCYTKMPFGLKNAGATYQRLVDNAFEGQVGRNLEVYVDDLVIKSHTEDE